MHTTNQTRSPHVGSHAHNACAAMGNHSTTAHTQMLGYSGPRSKGHSIFSRLHSKIWTYLQQGGLEQKVEYCTHDVLPLLFPYQRNKENNKDVKVTPSPPGDKAGGPLLKVNDHPPLQNPPNAQGSPLIFGATGPFSTLLSGAHDVLPKACGEKERPKAPVTGWP